MAKKSRARRARQPARQQQQNDKSFKLNRQDKRYIVCFFAISVAITLVYWMAGGRNLFLFPAVFCISVGASRYWRGPVRRFADKT